MNIITRYPVYVDHKMINHPDFYVLAEGDPKISPTSPTGKKKDGHVWNNLKGLWEKAKDTGIVDAATQKLRDKYGIKKQGSGDLGGSTIDPGQQSATDPNAAPKGGKKKGMSTGVKIGIAVGIALLITAAVYASKNRKKK